MVSPLLISVINQGPPAQLCDLINSMTPGPFQCWAALSSSSQTPMIWTKLTIPNGVVMGKSWASSAISMCWILDSLPSRGMCHGTWSPLNRTFSASKREGNVLLNLLVQNFNHRMKGVLHQNSTA